jgi:replicative DNA helicase
MEKILFIVRGVPGSGKSTFALQGVYKNAIDGTPTGFFSLEMSGGQLVDKLISRHTQIDSDRIWRMFLKIL